MLQLGSLAIDPGFTDFVGKWRESATIWLATSQRRAVLGFNFFLA